MVALVLLGSWCQEDSFLLEYVSHCSRQNSRKVFRYRFGLFLCRWG